MVKIDPPHLRNACVYRAVANLRTALMRAGVNPDQVRLVLSVPDDRAVVDRVESLLGREVAYRGGHQRQTGPSDLAYVLLGTDVYVMARRPPATA